MSLSIYSEVQSRDTLLISSITAPQDAHKLVLQVAEWLTASLLRLARHELTTYSLVQALKNKQKCCHIFTIVCKGREPISSDAGIKKSEEKSANPCWGSNPNR